MQDDDTANPGMLWVLDGEALWSRKAAGAGKACADCHGDARRRMRGVAARYPAYDAARGRPVDLEQRINLCRAEQQKAPRACLREPELLALDAYVGTPVARHADRGRTTTRGSAVPQRGRAVCSTGGRASSISPAANCHDDNWGKPLAGNRDPAGAPDRLSDLPAGMAELGSLQRRFRNCMIGVRAEPYAYGADEFVDLELYLMSRARGMPIETPAVRP